MARQTTMKARSQAEHQHINHGPHMNQPEVFQNAPTGS